MKKTLSFLFIIILTLSLVSVSFISEDSKAALPENRREINVEDFDNIDQWTDLTDHSNRFGHLSSSDDIQEITPDSYILESEETDWTGPKTNYTAAYDGLRVGEEPDRTYYSAYYDFEDDSDTKVKDRSDDSDYNDLFIYGNMEHSTGGIYQTESYTVGQDDYFYNYENLFLNNTGGAEREWAVDLWWEGGHFEDIFLHDSETDSRFELRSYYDADLQDFYLQAEVQYEDGTSQVRNHTSVPLCSGWNYIFTKYDHGSLELYLMNFKTIIYDLDPSVEFSLDDKELEWTDTETNVLHGGSSGSIDNLRIYDEAELSPIGEITPSYIDSGEAHFRRDVERSYYNEVRINTTIVGLDFEFFEVTMYGDDDEEDQFTVELDIQDGNHTYDIPTEFEVHETKFDWGFEVDEEEDEFLSTEAHILHHLELLRTPDHDYYVNRHGSQDRVEGMFSYRMEIYDDSSQSVSADLSWSTASWNISEYEHDIFPSESHYNIVYAFRIYRHDGQDNILSWDPDNEVEISHNRYQYQDSDTPESQISESQDFPLNRWSELEFRTGGIYDAAGFNISIETDEAFQGHLTVKLDSIRYTAAVTEVHPRIFNEFTGEGLDQDRLIIQYQDFDGSWRFVSGDSYYWVENLETDIRVLDYWGQEIYNSTVEPMTTDWVERIPIPVLEVEIQKPEPDVDPPLWDIRSHVTGESQGRETWTVELIADREYEFAWGPFGRYLGGSQLIDLTINWDTGPSLQSIEDGGLETEDDDVSDVTHGKAIADFSFNIDPDQYAGYPDLDIHNVSNFPSHHLAYIGYELFNIDYSDFNPHEDDIIPDFILAIEDTWQFRVIMVLWPISFVLMWYWRTQTKAVEKAEERMKKDEKEVEER